jgi:hypothetical protein
MSIAPAVGPHGLGEDDPRGDRATGEVAGIEKFVVTICVLANRVLVVDFQSAVNEAKRRLLWDLEQIPLAM